MRVPLRDICAGGKCRFYTIMKETMPKDTIWSSSVLEVSYIYYFYDKVEEKPIKKPTKQKRRKFGLFPYTIEIIETEMVPHYHVICEVCNPSQVFSPYCICYQSQISVSPRIKRDVDFWCLKSPVCNPHMFLPIKEANKYLTDEKWQDESKCPSFLPYPLRENKGNTQNRSNDNWLR